MKELQKYYAHDCEIVQIQYTSRHKEVYLASEADAAFAEMRREHVQALIEQRDTDSGRLHKIFDAEIERLKQHHAEEIERLKAQFASSNLSAEVLSGLVTKYRKQAERYEKLRAVSLADYPSAAVFDSYVDQLPASGEASVEVQARRTE